MAETVQTLDVNHPASLYQTLVYNYLSKLQYGGITIYENAQVRSFGNIQHKLQAIIKVKDVSFYKQIVWGGGLGLAEGYILGIWETEDLTKLLRILALNLQVVDTVDRSLLGAGIRFVANLMHYVNRNNLSGAKKNISHHYDLGNNFFQLFLDSNMMYSCARYTGINCSLEQASVNKLQLICEKLQLTATDKLLEIGTGWGGFAIYAVQNYNCHVTTITISQQQFAYTQSKINSLGLADKITVKLQDYRDVTGQYDKLVSIEMIEAVGHHYLDKYLHVCSKVLKPMGIFVLQAIVMPEQRYVAARDSVDFIKKYIFPGCCIPAVGEMMRSIRTHTDLNILQIEDLTLDYAKTLRDWRHKFMLNIASIKEQGFDNVFINKWLYYLCYCEAGFLERTIGEVQIVFAKPGYRDAAYISY